MGHFHVSVARSSETFNHIEDKKYLMNYKVKYATKQSNILPCTTTGVMNIFRKFSRKLALGIQNKCLFGLSKGYWRRMVT